ncbi:conserved hypothetical protein [Microsporum canis CBS 113480]|uniref:Uncharacterized protein n=1 Tax=Arthroderma otae (strain ATCC MYA-4605 / CBS 113480) TaxID=554155 RepID=C5FXT5_ARTOC|nr:conserved hypothetical protein [Microsporum canis CBS 113480]EEQ35125.1 conserved hypothetical protein [Microsporum canis CBS 113480]
MSHHHQHQHQHQHHHRRRQRLNAAASSTTSLATPSTAAPPASVSSGSPPAITAFRARFEAGRSFDLDDDLEFCPNLLTEDDLQSIHSLAASDRSSLGSASPDSSPLQHQVHPLQQQQQQLNSLGHSINGMAMSGLMGKIHQPAAVRTRNAIPIVNPSTGMRVSSPTRRDW